MTTDELEAWLRASAAVLHAEAAHLTELDQAIGDGDHGINMDRGFTAIVAKLDEVRAAGGVPGAAADGTADIGGLLRLAGRTLVSTVGGASGPLYGTAFLKAGAAVAGRTEIDIAAGVAALGAAIDGVSALGKAVAGDKTMLDALLPAYEAASAAVAAGSTAADVLRAAADAAAVGARATIPLVARKGRASYLGDRSAGHQDPGATSATLLLETLADVVEGVRVAPVPANFPLAVELT
jgi:dihydroxyacetone kinase-like protein